MDIDDFREEVQTELYDAIIYSIDVDLPLSFKFHSQKVVNLIEYCNIRLTNGDGHTGLEHTTEEANEVMKRAIDNATRHRISNND